MRILLLIAVILPLSLQQEEDWVDPNDPSPKSLLSTAGASETCHVPHFADDPSLRLILRRAFQRINVDPTQKVFFSRTAKLSLSSYNMAIISDYLDSDNDDISKRELVRSALHNMIEVLPEDSTTVLDSVFTFLWPWIVMGNMVILPSAAFFVLRSLMSTRSFWLSVLTIVILLSMVTTYNRMYQEKLAARLAAATEMRGDACAPAGLIEQGLDLLTGLVSLKHKSPCLKFVESQTVSIVSEISLLDVFSDVLSNGLFGWLSSLGPHLNKFYKGLCDGIPFHMLLLVFASMIFLFVRISTPLFTIEPLMITLLGNICRTVVQGLASTDHNPLRLTAIAKEHVTAVKDKNDVLFHNVTQRTPERIRRMQERKRREKIALKSKEESDMESIPSLDSSESEKRRSLSRGRDDGDF